MASGMMQPGKWIMALVVAVTACKQSGAQFSDSIHHNIGYSATGIVNQTNDGNSFVLNNGAKFNMNKKNKFFNSSAAWVYGRQNGVQTNNDFTSSLDFDIYKVTPGISPRLYYWGLVNYDKSFSLKINDRFQDGAGAGYTVSENKEANIVVSDGILYEYSNLKTDSVANDRYSTMRNSLRLKYHFVFKGMIVLDGIHFWQQSLSAWNDYLLKSNSTLSVKLKKWLNVTGSLSYNKVNRTHSKNLLFTVGLSADYYF